MFTPAPSQATHSEHSVQAEGEPGVRPAGTRPGAAGAGRAEPGLSSSPWQQEKNRDRRVTLGVSAERGQSAGEQK